MEMKLCRVCGTLTNNYVNIFKVDGLKVKLETCLPIIVSPHSLLPDTACKQCMENVENFYTFIKNCIQSIIILERQFDIHESCLKSRRKLDKGVSVDVITETTDSFSQTTFEGDFDSSLNIVNAIKDAERLLVDSCSPRCEKREISRIVDYDFSDGSNISTDGVQNDHFNFNFSINKQYFDNQENKIVSEITEKTNLKRRCDEILPYKTKIFKYDGMSRRKNRMPKKVDVSNSPPDVNCDITFEEKNRNYDLPKSYENTEVAINQQLPLTRLPQICLLCEQPFETAAHLTEHVFEMHEINMAHLTSSGSVGAEKRKKLPNLVKITDLKNKSADAALNEVCEDPPKMEPNLACIFCPNISSNPTKLYNHILEKHPDQSLLICRLCSQISTSHSALATHIKLCRPKHTIPNRYICSVCCFGDNTMKSIESHVINHDHLIDACRKQSKIFDPMDYVEINTNVPPSKTYTCDECNDIDSFGNFKEYSEHRRIVHQMFHCDLCNKHYGRSSHLWKHVNRLHRGHPSITCNVCDATSASKYHLGQHVRKHHRPKTTKNKRKVAKEFEDFMNQKFQGFDFQSVKQSFMRQEMLKEEPNSLSEDGSEQEDCGKNDDVEEESFLNHGESMPKEIDTSSNLYTNIITNYTPPQNDGEFKCPKCSKGFQKKNLLKKHKKNCRPRLQKDLLTRCKTCSRIFKDRQSLTKHLINYHTDYDCEICQKKFQSKCEIVSHIRFNHPKCHLCCSFCGNYLRNSEMLATHQRNHRNSFICHFCGDDLVNKIQHKMHILSLHRMILRISCGICLKLFETEHVLRDHVRLAHKDRLSKSNSCSVCGKSYASKWKTFDHMDKSHGKTFKACRACLEVFDTEEELQLHAETEHPKFAVAILKQMKTNGKKVKRDVYESDMDNNDENENDDKSVTSPENFQSDNDNENKGIVERKTDLENQNDENEFYAENKIFADDKCAENKNIVESEIEAENKISLLERQLTTNTKKVSKKSSKVKTNESPPLLKKETEDQLLNSSKRTVYVNSNAPSLCEICFKTWPAKKHLWQHYIRCHKSVAATVCGICLKANHTYETLQEHLHENHPTLLHGQGFGSNFICRICGRYHNASSKLKLHMAIHENFDWTILEAFENKNEADNGYAETKTEEINFESLIEEVECSSETENANSEDEKIKSESEYNEHRHKSENDVKSEESSSSSEESDGSESSDENSLETQMLRNMLLEKKILQNSRVTKTQLQEKMAKENVEMSSDDETSNSSIEYKTKSENSSGDESRTSSDQESRSDSANDNQQPEEQLHSAIQSICYDQSFREGADVEDDEYSEVQVQNLNTHEIQSAVDSIL